MGNPFLEITPHKVSRDLRGYSVFMYGAPKSGKTSTAAKFPNSVLLACEKGYGAIPNINVMPINGWRKLKSAVSDLDDDAVRERFQTVILDTADIAWNFCTKYIAQQMSTDKITYNDAADVPYSRGTKAAQKEFDDLIRRILYMGYGLVIISHAGEKPLKNQYGEDYQKWMPTLEKSCYQVVSAACDIIGYAESITDNDGRLKSKMYLRDTNYCFAGSRFKHMPNSIMFNFESLLKCVSDAVDAIADEAGTDSVTNDADTRYKTDEIAALLDEFQTMAKKLMTRDKAQFKDAITTTVTAHLGEGQKITDCTIGDEEKIKAVLAELKALQ